MRRARVLLADDHMMVAEGLSRILSSEFELAGIASDGAALVEDAVRLRPDVLVVDISMPVLNGIDATRKLHKLLPSARVIITTVHADPALVAAAFKAGASGYVLKRAAASELVAAIREALNGRCYISPMIVGETMTSLLSQNGPSSFALTTRQREVLQLVAEGRTSKEIAAILGVSVKTVEYHRWQLMHRLGLFSTAELTRYAIQQGISAA